MNSLFQKVEFITNIAIIFAAILLSVVLFKSYHFNQSVVSTHGNELVTSRPRIGTKFSLADADFAKNDKTLVLALSTTCHYCSESAPFYQQLAREHRATKLIAVLPQMVSSSRQYLSKIGVPVDDVKQVSFDFVGIQGTPTLLLINQEGVITDVWVGKLSTTQESEVLKSVM